MMRAVCCVTALFIFACGGGDLPDPTHAGDAEAEPSLRVLPDLQSISLSQRMRFGMLLAEESFGLRVPQFPDRRTTDRLQTWTESVLMPWLERKQHTVEAAREELDQAAEETLEQRVLAGALVGMLYEDVSRTFSLIPAPDELYADAEILAVYRDVQDAHASPFREHARRAYEACAANAQADRRFYHWRNFCGQRASRLPGSRFVAAVESGESEVTVVREAY